MTERHTHTKSHTAHGKNVHAWLCLFVVLLPGEAVCHSKYSNMSHIKGTGSVCVLCIPLVVVLGIDLMVFMKGVTFCDQGRPDLCLPPSPISYSIFVCPAYHTTFYCNLLLHQETIPLLLFTIPNYAQYLSTGSNLATVGGNMCFEGFLCQINYNRNFLCSKKQKKHNSSTFFVPF